MCYKNCKYENWDGDCRLSYYNIKTMCPERIEEDEEKKESKKEDGSCFGMQMWLY